MLFGNSVTGISAPLGSFAVGRFHVAFYDMFLVLVAGVLSALVWAVLRFTPAGLIARGTMQNAEMAAALGVAPDRASTRSPSAPGRRSRASPAALIAPLSGVVPTMGTAYIAKAFITVITGGAAMLTGTLAASGLLGSVLTSRHLPDDAGVRRGGAAGRRDRAAAAAAARHHRPLLAAGAVTPTRRTALEIGAVAIGAVLASVLLPQLMELYALINATVFVSMALLALSLGLIWGFGGILCFGQTAFFGLGAYTYAVAAINFGDTTWPCRWRCWCRRLSPRRSAI